MVKTIKYKSKIERVNIIGLMSALVLIFTFIKIQIPIGSTNTMIHLGGVLCLLSGFILGPIDGGISAGMGSFIFDILNPIYIISAPFTFIFKFFMAFVCGIISKKNPDSFLRNIVAATCGSLSYIILYITKTFLYNMFLINIEINANLILTTEKLIFSLVNGVLAVAIAVPLFELIKNSIRRYSS